MPTQLRAHETRAAIISAAASLFRSRGYGGTSQGDVAEAAGVTKGALYFHFTSKEHMALAVIATQHEAAVAVVDGVSIDSFTGVPALLEMTYRFAQLLRTDPIVQAGIRLTMEASNLSSPVVDPYLDWIKAAEAQLQVAVLAGDIPESIDIAAAARFIIPAFTGVQLVSEALDGRTDLYQRIEEMWAILLSALVRRERLTTYLQLSADLRRDISLQS